MKPNWSRFSQKQILSAHLMRPIKHALRTAAAALIALYISNLLSWPQGYWSVISAIIVMQSNIGGSMRASGSRLVGTAIGAISQAALAAIWGDNPWIMAAAIVAAMLACMSVGMPDACRLAGVTVVIVMLVPSTSPWVVILHRVTQVALGILIALAVSILVFPSRAMTQLRDGLAEALRAIGSLFDVVVSGYLAEKPAETVQLRDRIDAILKNNDNLMMEAVREATGAWGHWQILAGIARRVVGLRDVVMMLERTVEAGGDGHSSQPLQVKFRQELKDLKNAVVKGFEPLAQEISSKRASSTFLDPAAAISPIEEKLFELRRGDERLNYSLAYLVEFYSFFFGLKDLVHQLCVVNELAREFNTRRHLD